jgi:hypothetical protein
VGGSGDQDKPEQDRKGQDGNQGVVPGAVSGAAGEKADDEVDDADKGTPGDGHGGAGVVGADGSAADIVDGVGGDVAGSTATPNELESPSLYFHPRPASPGVVPAFQPIGLGDGMAIDGAFAVDDGNPSEGNQAQAGHESDANRESLWINGAKFTEEQWNAVPIVAHEVSSPNYNMHEADPFSSDPNKKFPPARVRQGFFLPDGSRRAAIGPGSVTFMPANLKEEHQYIENVSLLPDVIPAVRRIIAALGDGAGSAKIDGKLAIGMRNLAGEVVSGLELGLAFDGVGGTSVPDVALVVRDGSGVQANTGALRIGEYRVPLADGADGQVLVTDGDGEVAWADPSGGGSAGRMLLLNGSDHDVNLSETAFSENSGLDGTEEYVSVTASGGAVTITLTDGQFAAGELLFVKNVAASDSAVIVDGDGTDIDGASSLSLDPGECALLFKGSSEWMIS